MDKPQGTAASELGASFGVRLRRARDAAGLTQEELAARAGLTPNAISALERGEHRHPYPATVRALAAALDLAGEARAAFMASVPKRDRAANAVSPAPGLPLSLSPLVGREREVADVVALFRQDDVRLVTLTGPGGVGKTRLAVQIATDLAGDFAHGAKFVALAAVRDHALVASTIAHTLGVGEASGRSSADRLGDALRNRHLLLVLDNYEHVLNAAPLVTDLLSWCPTLTVLTTSRSPLRLAGEYVHPVPPLALPDPDRLPSAEELAGVAAIRLFVARARAADPAFALTGENAGAVAAICHRLDGLPLAIELAATRSTVLAPAALLPLLARSLPLLTGGRRDAPERQRTLRDAIAWSYGLLADEEQALFRRLAVFDGGVTAEAAGALWATMAAAAGEQNADTFAGVAALADHSLLRHEPGPGGVPRYLMLETVREFGLEQLAEAGEERAGRDAHAAYFAALDERLEPNRLDPDERFDDRLLRIEADHANCRAALAHLAATGDAAAALRLAGALAVFWHHRGHLREGRRWLEWSLERTADEATLWRGRALAGLSLVVWSQGDPDGAEPPAEAALAIGRQIGDPELTALSFHLLGMVESLRGRPDKAEPLMEEARVRWRAFGTPTNEAMALNALSGIARQRGDAQTSARLAEEALALFRATGHASGTAMALSNVARLAANRGDDVHAVAAYQEALRLWASIGERSAIAWAFSGLAALAAVHGQPEQAATLVGVVDTRLDEIGADLLMSDRRLYDRAAANARAALGEERFAELRDAGRALAFVAAVTCGEAVALQGQPGCPSTSALESLDATTLTATRSACRSRGAPSRGPPSRTAIKVR